MIYAHDRISPPLRATATSISRRGVWASISLAVFAMLLTHGIALAGGFSPDETGPASPPILLAEFRAPSAASLFAPTLPRPPALLARSPDISARRFRAPGAGPDDEVAGGRDNSVVAALPPRGRLDIALTPSELANPAPGASRHSAVPAASHAAVAPTELADRLIAFPEGIERLPALDDAELPADATATPDVPTPADRSGEVSADVAALEPTAGTSDTATAAELVPTPDASSDGEVVEIEEVVVETYGWSYLGMWLGERMTPRRIEAGGTYASGTRDSWSALLKARWEVEEERYDDELTVNGTYTEVDDERSNNEWIAKDTFDWKAPGESPWRVFFKSHAEYDEIEKLSFRGTVSTGLGYAWFKEADRKLTTRVGPSYTYERFFDPRDTNDKPEMLAEIQFKWTFFDSVVLEHQSSAYPAFKEEDGIRVNDETGLLTPIGTSPFWSWKLGLRHQYNNKPNTAVERNEYQASLMLVYDR